MLQVDSLPKAEVDFLQGYYAQHPRMLPAIRPEKFVSNIRDLVKQTCFLRGEENHTAYPCMGDKIFLEREEYYAAERGQSVTRTAVLQAFVHRGIHVFGELWKGQTHPPQGVEDTEFRTSLEPYLHWEPTYPASPLNGNGKLSFPNPGKALHTLRIRMLGNATPEGRTYPGAAYEDRPTSVYRMPNDPEPLQNEDRGKTLELPPNKLFGSDSNQKQA